MQGITFSLFSLQHLLICANLCEHDVIFIFCTLLEADSDIEDFCPNDEHLAKSLASESMFNMESVGQTYYYIEITVIPVVNSLLVHRVAGNNIQEDM